MLVSLCLGGPHFSILSYCARPHAFTACSRVNREEVRSGWESSRTGWVCRSAISPRWSHNSNGLYLIARLALGLVVLSSSQRPLPVVRSSPPQPACAPHCPAAFSGLLLTSPFMLPVSRFLLLAPPSALHPRWLSALALGAGGTRFFCPAFSCSTYRGCLAPASRPFTSLRLSGCMILALLLPACSSTPHHAFFPSHSTPCGLPPLVGFGQHSVFEN